MLKEVLVGLAYMKMLVRMRIESEPSTKRGFLISAKIFHQWPPSKKFFFTCATSKEPVRCDGQ